MTRCRTSSEFERALLLALLLATGGCMGGIRSPAEGRTPQEMLLLSRAAERALGRYDPRPWRGLRVAVDVSRLRSVDPGYVRAALRAHLARHGCRVVDDLEGPPGPGGADIVLEVRVAGLGLEDLEYEVGVPDGLPLPFLPGGGGPGALVRTSGLSFGYERQAGWALLQVWARDARTGAFRGESPRLWGTSYEAVLDDIWPSRAGQAAAREADPAGDRKE